MERIKVWVNIAHFPPLELSEVCVMVEEKLLHDLT